MRGKLVGQLGHLVIGFPFGDDARDEKARIRIDQVHVRGIKPKQVRGNELVGLFDQPREPRRKDFGAAGGQQFEPAADLILQFSLLGPDAPANPRHKSHDDQGDDGHAHDQFRPVPAHGG